MKVQEEWRDVPGYEGYYQASSHGRVRSIDRYVKHKKNNIVHSQSIKGRVLKQLVGKRGYLLVDLYRIKKRKNTSVHIIIAMAFLGYVRNGKYDIVVDHIDNNQLNNYESNLQIITNRRNTSKDQWRHNRTSQYVGVHFDDKRGKWYSSIYIKGKQVFIGRFYSEIDASKAYQHELIKLNKDEI